MMNLPYDIMELIMNKKHQLEIEAIKKAHILAITEWEKEVLDLKQQLHELDEVLEMFNQ
jgi:hypothetical protein